jgi:hypothetical protein
VGDAILTIGPTAMADTEELARWFSVFVVATKQGLVRTPAHFTSRLDFQL